VIEDAQWMDPTSRRLAAAFISHIGSQRIMCVITHRDGLAKDIAGGSKVSHINLSRLSPDACTQMIENLAGGARMPRFLLNRISQQSDGIPLIIEELSRAVLNSGALERVGEPPRAAQDTAGATPPCDTSGFAPGAARSFGYCQASRAGGIRPRKGVHAQGAAGYLPICRAAS